MTLRRAWHFMNEAAGLIQDEPGFETELAQLDAMLDKIDATLAEPLAMYTDQFEPTDYRPAHDNYHEIEEPQ